MYVLPIRTGGGPTVLSMSRSGGYAARQIEYIEDTKGVVMDDYLKEALEITRAQAGVRVMSEEEIAAFIPVSYTHLTLPTIA